MAHTLAPQGARDTLWAAYNDLRVAHKSLGLSAGALRSLQAILSFVTQGNRLVIHAGNRILCERAATSDRTLRRHITELVKLGLIQRRSSTNGKRFRVSAPAGDLVFGLDVSPLVSLATSLADHARAVRTDEAEIKQARQVLLLALKRAETQGDLEECELTEPRKKLRRKLSATALLSAADELLSRIPAHETNAAIDTTAILAACDSQNGRHIQETRKEESLLSCSPNYAIEKATPETELRKISEKPGAVAHQEDRQRKDAPDLLAIARACPEATAFSDAPLRNDEDVMRFAWSFGPLIGIPRSLLQEGARALGPAFAAGAVMRIAQAGINVRSPGAYFRALMIGPKANAFARSLMLEPRQVGRTGQVLARLPAGNR
ncbi:plasmid replication protein RepC [Pararhodobacter sp. CCB-MM2]|uniref:plasmid replication protein RepC n=1 Tax=Pararhodobacter sp. CCB-MM2 TaxID=1786003 RepID=UPI0008356A53|nr:plasmid replication protein RepC [Pararhodobacter sp. CCB-MM2]